MLSVKKKVLESPKPHELHGKRLYGYSAGILGQLLPFSFTGALVFIYYVYVIGLSPILVSVGTLAGFIIKGVASPLCGMIVDKKQPDKLGKRRSLLLWVLPIFLTSFIFLWISSPLPEPEAYNYRIAIQLWIILSIFYFSFTLLRTTYLSMLPEQSQTEKNRIKISEIQGIFSIFASLIAILLPIILFALVDNPQNIFNTTPNGILILKVVPWIALSFGFISMILTIVIFFSVNETIVKMKTTELRDLPSEITSKTAISQLLIPLEDKKYIKYLMSLFFWNIGIQILLKIMFFLFTYVLELIQKEYLYLAFFVLPFAGIGILFWVNSIKKKGLKWTYLSSTLIAACALLAGLIFLIPMPKIIRLVISIFVLGSLIACIIPGYILPNPIISSFIDHKQKEMKEGNNIHEEISGAYFGLFLMVLSFGYAIGDLLTGIIFVGNTQNPEIIAILLPLISLFLITAIIWIRNVKFN
jgi:Na+/melibiose symporter-like transporter